jgi:hypothetical protein
MKIFKGKANSVLFLLLIICFASVQMHADTFQRSLFAKSYGPLFTSPSLGVQSFSGNGQAGWRSAGYGSEFGNVAITIMAGVAGNVVGMYAGAFLGFVIPPGPVVGGIAGSACGSALGVYFAGSSGGRGGNFGSALLGSLLGELAAFGLALAIHTEDAPFMAGFLLLPPIGAALAFNSSQRSRSIQAGNGLLNLAEGKLGLGVPDIQVRPSYVPGLKAKPELQFNMRVLSVEL